MLKFTLQDLAIFISERSEGSFRQARAIRQFLEKQSSLEQEDFNLLHLQLENKSRQVVIEEKDLSERKATQIFTGDAILTNFKGGEKRANKTLISMVVADCFPLIFFDQKSKNVVMVHTGWQPLYLGILDEVWQKMLKLWQAQPANIWAFLGPGIRAQSYCLASKPRQSQDLNWQKFIKEQERRQANLETRQWQIDLPGFIKDFLLKKGLPITQLLDSQLNTYSDERFFSYRRSQELKELGQKELAGSGKERFFLVCQLPGN
jgi:copper oxidase (laccase) domain-containing protein